MTNYDYRMANGYEVTPKDIAKNLLPLAYLDITDEENEIVREQMTGALYYLEAICQKYNDDKLKTLYNVLAHIADQYI